MMCQRMGRLPISTIGFGLSTVSSERRLPTPPARIATFMAVPQPERSSRSRSALQWPRPDCPSGAVLKARTFALAAENAGYKWVRSRVSPLAIGFLRAPEHAVEGADVTRNLPRPGQHRFDACASEPAHFRPSRRIVEQGRD